MRQVVKTGRLERNLGRRERCCGKPDYKARFGGTVAGTLSALCHFAVAFLCFWRLWWMPASSTLMCIPQCPSALGLPLESRRALGLPTGAPHSGRQPPAQGDESWGTNAPASLASRGQLRDIVYAGPLSQVPTVLSSSTALSFLLFSFFCSLTPAL